MKKTYVALSFGTILSIIGMGAWIIQVKNGLAVTNLNNLFSWGLYMSSFEFFIGLSSGGMLVYAIHHIWKIDALRSFAQIGPIASLISAIAAGIAILTDLGRPFSVLQMLLTPNLLSPLFWDMMVLGIYAILCAAALYFQILAFKTKQQNKKQHKVISVITLPYIAVLNGVTTLLFAMQHTKLWWHSALLPVDSIVIAITLGCSFMMLLGLLFFDKTSLKKGISLLSIIALAAIMMHFVFTVFELATLAWNSTAESKELMHLLFDTFGIWYGMEQLLFIIAFCGYLFGLRKQPVWMVLSSLAVLLAVFVHRIMLTLPAFNMVPLTLPAGTLEGTLWTYPIASGIYQTGQDIFITEWMYMPTLIEWGVAILPAGVIVLCLSAIKIFFSKKLITQKW